MKITIADAMGYIAAVLVFTTFWMKTMIPLRVLGLGSNVFFYRLRFPCAGLSTAGVAYPFAAAQHHAVARNAAIDQAR
jgi:hypothetical protein